jgi:hypothetical protein
MKKYLPLIAFVLIISATAEAQDGIGVTNLGFENWSSSFMGETLDGWVTLNAAKEETDVYEGNYSIYLESAEFLTFGLQPGLATIGELQGFTAVPGEAYTEVPSIVEGYVKYNLLENDTALFYLELTQYYQGATTTIAHADTMFAGTQEEWTHFSLNIQWETWGIPDSIQIGITSGGNSDMVGQQIGTVTAGSWLKADSFNLSNEVSIEDALGVTDEILIFPNPCKGKLYVRNAKNTSVSIYNMLGQKVFSQKKTDISTLNLSTLNTGNYIIEFNTAQKKEIKKLSVIK